jgi:hypothetical protein
MGTRAACPTKCAYSGKSSIQIGTNRKNAQTLAIIRLENALMAVINRIVRILLKKFEYADLANFDDYPGESALRNVAFSIIGPIDSSVTVDTTGRV